VGEINVREIERIYRDYIPITVRLKILLPKFTAVLSPTAGVQTSHDGNKTEELATLRADLEAQKELVETCIEIMSQEQKDFIQFRYFDNQPVKQCAFLMNCEEREVYRTRNEVIVKPAWLLGYNACVNDLNRKAG
jgi:hypothetical protein